MDRFRSAGIVGVTVLTLLFAPVARASFDDGTTAFLAGNFVAAAQQWQSAAMAGDPRAQFRMGFLYEKGRGVPQNFIEAHRWYNLAGAQGNEEAVRSRDRVAKDMTVDELAKARALAASWQPTVAAAAVPPTTPAPAHAAPASAGALYRAAEAGDVAKIRDLLAQGVDVNAADQDGWTALFYAAGTGRTDAVKALAESNANLDMKGSRSGETALMVATAGGYAAVVEALLQAGADRSVKDSKGRTAQQFAALRPNPQMMKALQTRKLAGGMHSLQPAAAAPVGAVASAKPQDDAAKAAALGRTAELPAILVQYALVGVGLLTGDPDGVVGPRTRDAMSAWQKSLNDTPTGALAPAEVVALIQAAADKGQAESQNTLGLMLATGAGLPQDDALAVTWFSRAADQSAQGKYNLAHMVRDGRGVAKDPARATALLTAAKAGGYGPAGDELARQR